MELLTDLNWLRCGEIFPPRSEALRLSDYAANEKLFDGDSYTVYKPWYQSSERRLERVLGEAKGVITYAIEVNYHRLTSTAIADLICGEPPSFTAADGSEQESILQRVLTHTRLLRRMHAICIDLSRYGDAVLRLYRDDAGQAAIVQYNPSACFKVVDAECPDKVTQYVLATARKKQTKERGEEDRNELIVQIHEPGRFINQVWRVEACYPDEVRDRNTNRVVSDVAFWRLVGLESEEVRETGLSGFAVFTLSQLMTSGRVWGHDDYCILDPILAEIWARFGHIAAILDKHAEPDAYAPMSAFEEDANGTYRLRTGGNTYIVEPGESAPGYITWDGQLTAAFTEIEKLFEQLYKLSEMGAIYTACLTGAAISTETAKMHFVKPLSKARRIVNGIEDSLLDLICAAAELEGHNLTPEDITVKWFDGLPNDELQEIRKAEGKIRAELSTPERENRERFGVDQNTAAQIAREVEDRNAVRAASMFAGAGMSYDDEEGSGVDA